MPNISFLNPETIHTPRGYTHIVEATGGRTVYISGQVALDPQGQLVGVGDFRAQAQQVFQNLQSALQAVGGDFGNVVKFTIFVLDMTQLPILREVRDQYVNTQNPPASTAVEVRQL